MSVAAAVRCGSLAAVEAALQSGSDVNGCVCYHPALLASLASHNLGRDKLLVLNAQTEHVVCAFRTCHVGVPVSLHGIDTWE